MTAFAPPQRTDVLTFAAEWLQPSQVRITVHGEIDAYNAHQLADYVFRRAANCKEMILDMSGVQFFSTAGFACLRTIEIRCAQAGVRWTLIPSHAVARVLAICDPRDTFPTAAA